MYYLLHLWVIGAIGLFELYLHIDLDYIFITYRLFIAFYLPFSPIQSTYRSKAYIDLHLFRFMSFRWSDYLCAMDILLSRLQSSLICVLIAIHLPSSLYISIDWCGYISASLYVV